MALGRLLAKEDGWALGVVLKLGPRLFNVDGDGEGSDDGDEEGSKLATALG